MDRKGRPTMISPKTEMKYGDHVCGCKKSCSFHKNKEPIPQKPIPPGDRTCEFNYC